jgi:diamine N-acetyltransferase
MLKGKTITLRETEQQDLAQVVDAEKRESTSGFVILWSLGQHQEAMRRESVFHYIIEEIHSKEFIGYVICNRDVDDNFEIMRLVITKKRNGYGTQAIRLLVEFAFNVCACNRVWLDVRSHNDLAFELYKKLGFIHEGTLRNCVKFGSSYVSVHVLSILKQEYIGSGIN